MAGPAAPWAALLLLLLAALLAAALPDEKDGFISAASALPSMRRRDELLGCEAVKSGGVQLKLKLGRSFPFVS
ncbi:hypothetical protein TURU_085430 [Turdus rufiventris]|nr:hypothetical protein TURU_085430 [Turdus rufiventris]